MVFQVEAGWAIPRCPGSSNLHELGSLHVDLQQRSCEFLELLGSDWDSHRPGILDRMPVPDKDQCIF